MSLREEIRAELGRRLEQLERRQAAIRSDRRREEGPLDRDWKEQAVERENDEVLDALDAGGVAELEQIRSALGRIDRPDFAVCSECGEKISAARMCALPTASRCLDCAE
jgi:RNA polymerase-binding transcription factor DksA